MELLERSAQLDLLHRLLRAAADRHGRLLLLGGEAGVGKSALLRRFAADAQESARVLVGACDPLSTPRPLGPLVDVAADLGPEPDRLLTNAAPRAMLFRAVLAALAGGPRATCFVIEDVHWADEATLDLLRYLGRRAEATRALVVATYRDDEVGPRHPLALVVGDLATAGGVERLTLPPLTCTAVAALAAGSGHDAAALHRRTGGNPFFVTELLAGGGLPPTIRDAVLARSARLPPATRAVLDAAAVLAAPTDAALLAGVAAVDAEAVEESLNVGILRADGCDLSFRHELAREAILSAISPIRRSLLHARALAALTASPSPSDPTRLAHHAEEAGDRAAVLTYAPEAARRATALGAHRQAAAQYARALRFGTQLPAAERADLLEARSYASYLTAQIEEAIADRQAALALRRRGGDTRRAGMNRCHLVVLFWAANRVGDAEREARDVVATLEALPPGPELATAYGTLARLRAATADGAAAIAWGERAIALAQPLAADETLIHALITVGATKLAVGDGPTQQQGRALLERAGALAERAGLDALVARATYSLGVGDGEQRRFAAAAEHLSTAISFCAERDLDHSRWLAAAWLAHARLHQGRWSEATELANAVLRASSVSPVARYAALYVAGMVAARQGGSEAAPRLDEALALAEMSRNPARVGSIRTGRAEAAWLAGEAAHAAAEARAAPDLVAPSPLPWYAGDVAYWRWRTGDPTPPPDTIAAPYALQLAGDWAAAAAAWDDLGCPYEAARTRADGGDIAALRLALTTFQRLGARPAATLARHRLERLGEEALPRGPRPSTRANPAGLTRREIELLTLVAAGHSNPAIAARLFLSPRTVENHVASAMAKLGAASRGDAVATARTLGILAPN